MKLRIEKPIYGGSGLTRATEGELSGKAIFVPFTLPGELAEVRISEDKRSFAQAELLSIIEPAADRVAPKCPYFYRCGGCDYQHADYPQQLAMKTAILAETLARAHVGAVPAIQTIGAAPYGYRNRIRLHAAHGPFSLAYKRRGSHEDLRVTECPIAAPVLEQALRVLNEQGEALGVNKWFDEMELFTNHDGSELLLTLWANTAITDAALEKLCHALRSNLPALSGAAVFHAGARTIAPMARWGEQSLTYNAGAHRYQVGLGSFFQVNRFLIDPLLEAVTTGSAGDLAWDLYSGVGLFAARLAGSFQRVTAVESSPASSRDLSHNLHGGRHRIVETETLGFLERQKAAPDLIVLDPPRAGLGPSITALLAAIHAPKLVYVSCDPATLARDLRALIQSGYQVQSLSLVDLFPQTYHMESVAVLT